MKTIKNVTMILVGMSIPFLVLGYLVSTTPDVKAGIRCVVDVKQCRR